MIKRHRPNKPAIALLLLIPVLLFLMLGLLLSSPSDQALQTVNKFYKFEQDGNFSGSWEMFHPFMKEKFSKGHYLQDRAHVFMNHFGVETFSYTLGKPKKIKKWKPANDALELSNVYKVPVILIYKGRKLRSASRCLCSAGGERLGNYLEL